MLPRSEPPERVTKRSLAPLKDSLFRGITILPPPSTRGVPTRAKPHPRYPALCPLSTSRASLDYPPPSASHPPFLSNSGFCPRPPPVARGRSSSHSCCWRPRAAARPFLADFPLAPSFCEARQPKRAAAATSPFPSLPPHFSSSELLA